jgi:hypothetical protein
VQDCVCERHSKQPAGLNTRSRSCICTTKTTPHCAALLQWELFTGQQAFKGVPKALLGHEVAKLGRRPEFPPDCPFDYQLLAVRCWESDPAIRCAAAAAAAWFGLLVVRAWSVD